MKCPLKMAGVISNSNIGYDPETTCDEDLCQWWMAGFAYDQDGNKIETGRCAFQALAESTTSGSH